MTTVTDPVAGAELGGFTHLGLVYHDQADYLAGVMPFLQGALAAGEPLLVAVPPPNLDLIRTRLGSAGSEVRFADMTMAGRNPGRILPSVLLDFTDAHQGQQVAIVGEPVWSGRSAEEYPACVTHEALINTAFAGRNATVLCPYDGSGLAPEVTADAYRTHPLMMRDGRQWKSPAYEDPLAVAAAFNQPMPPPPPEVAVVCYPEPASLSQLRQLVSEYARAAGVADDRSDDLMVAVNELATNTLEHGGGSGRFRVWTEAQALVCQIDDRGHIADPLAGRVPASAMQAGGRGLVVVNHLCDLVRTYTSPAGTTVKLFTYL